MSINKSILDYISVNEVLDNTLPYFETKRKYYIIGIVSNLKLYDQVEIYLKSNDNKYIIRSIVAGLFIDDLDQCFKKKRYRKRFRSNFFKYKKNDWIEKT